MDHSIEYTEMTTLETKQVYSTCNCSEEVVYTHQTGPLPLNLRFIARRGPGRLQSALQHVATQHKRNNKERFQRITIQNQVHWRSSRPHTLGIAGAERSREGSDPNLQRQTSQRPGAGNCPKHVDDIPPHDAAAATTRIQRLPIGTPRMATS